MYHDIPEDLKQIVEPVVQEHGCELVDVVVRPNLGEGLIRVVIDDIDGNGRVSIESLESISREIGDQFDAVDFMKGRYRLEVTSPGLDRILAREKDFVAALGSKVSLQTRRPIESRKRFKGVLTGFEDGIARLEVDVVGEKGGEKGGKKGKAKGEVQIPFREVEKANSIYQFSREDFAGEASGRASK